MKSIPIEILQRCHRAERRAQQELFQLVYGWMTGICRRYYRNTEDCSAIATEAFLKILKALEKQIPTGSFEAWCRTITMNTIIDDYRKNKVHKEAVKLMGHEDLDINEHVFNEAHQRFDKEDLEALLLQLPDMTRYVFNLFAIEGFSHQEIAGALKISDGTSKWHVSEARRQLKQWIEVKTK